MALPVGEGVFFTSPFGRHRWAHGRPVRGPGEGALDSGGYLAPVRPVKYGLLETAATVPYTECGFTKLICISHLDDFLLHHMPNVYLGILGLPLEEVKLQIETLTSLEPGAKPLFETEKKNISPRFNKFYYERKRKELLDLVPADSRSVLSVGCGWGESESDLIEKGKKVTGIPLDPVIAISARRRGVEITPPDFDRALEELSDRRFDCLFLSETLQHIADPVKLLNSLRPLLAPGGAIVGSVPNFRRLDMKKKLFPDGLPVPSDLSFSSTSLHLTTRKEVSRWLGKSGFGKIETALSDFPHRRALSLFRFKPLGDYLASTVLFRARKT